jgi:hypothetical protein
MGEPSMTPEERATLIAQRIRPAYRCGDPSCVECADRFEVYHRADEPAMRTVPPIRVSEPEEQEAASDAACSGCGVPVDEFSRGCDTCESRRKKRAQRARRGR